MLCTVSEASGLADSAATTANPLPTHTYNEAQPPFPSGTAGTAAVQTRRDDPHLADNGATCLCSLCHLKDRFFPRSQDGRILLPHPSFFIHSARLLRPTATITRTSAAPLATPGLVTRSSNQTQGIISNRAEKFNQGRRGGLRTLHQSDQGEESSTAAGRMFADIGQTPHRNSRQVIMTDESQHTPQLSGQDNLESPFSGQSPFGLTNAFLNSIQVLQSVFDHLKERSDPWPRILESEESAKQSSQYQSSHHLFDISHKTRLEFFLDEDGTAHPQNRLQTPQAREFSPQTVKLRIPRSATPVTAPQTISNYPKQPDGVPSHHLPHYSTNRPESPTDTSRSDNLQPDSNPSPAIITTGKKNANPSPTRDPCPPHSPSSSSHQLQSGSSSSSVQTQFRFEEPVVPQPHTTSPMQPRELSVVQVKWDSERKRRQGYFAQEEGSEKSRFRHYNKANCDFES